MAISAISLGRNSTVEIDTADSTASMTAIGGIFTGSFTQTNNTIAADHNDAGAFSVKEFGNQSVSLTFSARYDPTDAGQLELEGAFQGAAAVSTTAGRVKKEFRVRPIVGSGESQWIFTGLVTSVVRNPGVNEEAVNFDVTIESTEAITYSTQ